MKQAVTKSFFITITLLLAGLFLTIGFWQEKPVHPDKVVIPGTLEKEEKGGPERIEKKIARSEYFFRLLRDPATNSIPPNIRNRELNFAKQLPTRNQIPLQLRAKDGIPTIMQFDWESVGPGDVGGRTRALGIDQRNPNIIIAGGVSGGIWKSTDGGTTWQLKTDPSQNLSVTSLAQDPTDPDTWYYTSGEFRGNSAADQGGRASYYGTGVFVSDDNGETWNKIPTTDDRDETFNSPYDFITRVVVSPTGSVFIASNGIGIYRSTDLEPFPPDPGTGASPDPVLGTFAGHLYCDVAVAPDGTLAAVLSQAEADGDPNPVPGANHGIFISENDGVSNTWQEITPSTFPAMHERSVLAFAPSAPDTLYVLTYVSGSEENEDVRLHLIDLNGGGPVLSEDRSNNIPDFGGSVGYMNTQQNYNMVVAIKPDDPDFVLIGGTNLFRSFDGFATPPDDTDWIGGYDNDNDISQYPNQHADQHVLVFDPGNSNIMWAGHDGGLSRTTDITANPVSWSDMNNGYITTQFYAVSIPSDSADTRVMGGTQDNGSLFWAPDQSIPTEDISFGDGGYAYFTPTYLFVSRQEGSIIRHSARPDGSPGPGQFAFVHPSGASNQLFIHPYVVDPTNENIMYYPEGDSLWRNTQINQISFNNTPNGVPEGWESFEAVDVASGFTISALEVSTTPSNILYYGASSDNAVPKIFRLFNASNSDSFQDISIAAAEAGSYVHDIAINPANANELLVIMSNYNVPSIFHTPDGGATWQNVDGNLGALNDEAGPSVRSATIIPGEEGTIYILGTSTGVYSTTGLSGAATQWVQEASGSIGFAVTEYITSRTSDGTVAAGTHGRGIFKGDFQGDLAAIPFITVDPASARAGVEITITATNFSFSTSPEENQVTFNGVPATVVEAAPTELRVIVPRGTIPPEVESNFVQIRATVDNLALSASFEVLPPNEFVVSQNFPNPFNPTTKIPFDLPERSGVIIQIFDMTGRKVLEPVRQVLEPRTYNFPVDLSGLASGVYIYRIVAIPREGGGDPNIESKKMTLIK